MGHLFLFIDALWMEMDCILLILTVCLMTVTME